MTVNDSFDWAGGTVNITAGVLSLQFGVSTGSWNITNGAALNLIGTGTAPTAQVYVFNPGSSFSYPVSAASATTGLVIIDGAGDGGMSVQTDLSVNQISLYGGTLGGSGTLTVSNQMTWFGGAMTTARSTTGSNPYGSISIPASAALFILDADPNGQPVLPVLGRPLNIAARWVGSAATAASPWAR